MKKIKFRKLQPTGAFTKLFGLDRGKPDDAASRNVETGAAYEYYHKRGNTYYFRNSAGEKFSVAYEAPQPELVRGNTYTIDTINKGTGA